jgi:DNA-directed RNA polymerase specialized sigma subunit
MVERAIQALPEIYREVFVLRDVEGLRAEEAAQVLGVTVAALTFHHEADWSKVRDILVSWVATLPLGAVLAMLFIKLWRLW